MSDYDPTPQITPQSQGGPHPTIVRTTVGQAHSGSPAGFWRRFGAISVDSIIIGLALWPVNIVILLLFQFATGVPFKEVILHNNIMIQAINFLIKIVAVYFYFGYFYSSRGATPGKQLFKLKVLNSETGTYLNYNQTFMREVIGKYLLDTLTLGIGYLMAAFREDHKALHDIAFKTQVIKQG